jgi:hypothetical protein
MGEGDCLHHVKKTNTSVQILNSERRI